MQTPTRLLLIGLGFWDREYTSHAKKLKGAKEALGLILSLRIGNNLYANLLMTLFYGDREEFVLNF